MMLAVPRRAALIAIAVLVAAASAASFTESYRGLYDWAAGHGLTGAWAVIWPVQVDVFIAVGELALFVALADRWAPRSRAAAWTVTGVGLAVSVAGNVGHAAGHSVTNRVTAAVPPLAAALALAVALGVLKRVVEAHHDPVPATAPATVPVGVPVARRVPSVREVRDRQNCGPETAKKILAEIRAYERSRGGSPARVPVAQAPAASPPGAAGASKSPPAGVPSTAGHLSAPAGAIPSSNGKR